MKNVVCGFVLVFILFSCKKELSEEQKVFLDFAKLENSYSGSSYFYNLDLYSSFTEEPVYYDSIFNFEKLKTELQGTTKILKNDDGYIRVDYSQVRKIQYPIKFILTENKSNSFDAKMLLFIPDGYERFSIDKSQIGEKISKKGMNITLLDFRNDAVTLAIENTSTKNDYSYTYEKRNERKEDDSNKSNVGYYGYLFTSERVTEPNSSSESRNDKNKEIQVDFDRLNISLVDTDGKTIGSEGQIIDFRHYLWYRNHDMPYQDMISSYRDLKNRYKEEDTNPDHLYNPIQIVNIRGLGKIKKINFFLRSDKGQIKTIDLGAIPNKESIKENNKEEKKYSFKYESYLNLNESIVKNDLKVNIATLDKENSYMIYASLPSKYSEDLHFSFSDMYLKTDKNDSIMISDYQDAMSRINLSVDYASNINAIEILNEKDIYNNIVGKIEIRRPIYEEKKYDITNLPSGYTYDKKNKSLEIKFEKGYYDEYYINGFASLNSKELVPNTFTVIEFDHVLYNFKENLSHIIIQHRKEEKNISVPFKLKISKKTE